MRTRKDLYIVLSVAALLLGAVAMTVLLHPGQLSHTYAMGKFAVPGK